MTLSTSEHELICTLPRRVRDTAPLIHCMTNMVVSNFTANVLLALGASPAMVPAPEDAPTFAAIADALLINIGTLEARQLQAMHMAIAGASDAGKPWVFDPITAGLPFRLAAARELLALKPAVIRGNASEIMALHSIATSNSKGVDSRAKPEEAIDAAQALARSGKAIVAVSGPIDYVTDGTRTLTISGGHPFMTRVTGVGCALNAVIAAYIAGTRDPLLATTAALSVFAQCGAEAAQNAKGTGSFAVAFLDALTQVETLTAAAIG